MNLMLNTLANFSIIANNRFTAGLYNPYSTTTLFNVIVNENNGTEGAGIANDKAPYKKKDIPRKQAA